MTTPFRVFFSHSHADAGLVRSLGRFIGHVFGVDVALRFSSSLEPGSGVPAGAEWVKWLREQLIESQCTVVVLTAESINNPWILMEVGVTLGASFGAEGKGPKIVPVVFGIEIHQIPQALMSFHAVYGEVPSIKRLFNSINAWIGKYEQPILDVLFEEFFPSYQKEVRGLLEDRPLMLDEPTVNEWLVRLEKLEARGRWAEVEHYHRAMLLAFANRPLHDPAQDETLLDIRIHRALGEMYLASSRPGAAANQLAKASKLAHERDLFLLHKLGLAYLQDHRLYEAECVLGTIEKLDPDTARTNPEIADLVGRLHREKWDRTNDPKDLERARDAYRAGLEATRKVGHGSYFMADNVGQLSLLLNDMKSAREAFTTVRNIVVQSGEKSVWAFASLASACFVLGDEEAGFTAIAKLRAQGPEARQLDSISKGLERIRDGMGIPAEVFERWLAHLLGKFEPS